MGDQRPSGKFLYRLNDNGLGPELLHQVFMERGWIEYDEEAHDEDEWHLWWRTSRFRNSDYDILKPWQQMNHYPRSTAITKKDSLARNLKRMRGVYGPGIYNFSPVAFNLPNDYTKFVAEYSRMKEQNPNKDFCWICKPADLSRGRGIFIFRDLSELQYDCNAVVQQYLTNPMLISGYKFDLRIYVMVPSFHPLKIFIYQEGLVRFGTEKFDMNSLGNLFSHLTNTSINKHSPSYTADKERVGPGCKWTLTQLRHYFRQANIDDELLWRRIINIVVLTLALQANQVPKVSNCFELYGFDVIIDDQVKPWLLEVNFSPALSSDCQTDLTVKKPMLHDLFDFLNFPELEVLRLKAEKAKQPKRNRVYSGKANPGTKLLGRFPGKTSGRLPQIVSSSSNTLTVHHQADGLSSYPVEDEEEEEETDGSDVVPVIPGCGLPSVQGPRTRRLGEWASSRGSSASSRRSGDNGDLPTGRSESRSSSVMSQSAMRRNDSKGSQLMRLSDISQEPVKEGNLSQQGKRDSKISLQSDSGVSSLSGSSENADNHTSSETVLHRNNMKGKRTIKNRKAIQQEQSSSSSPFVAKSGSSFKEPVQSPNFMSKPPNFSDASSENMNSSTLLTSTGLMNRYALTDFSDIGLPNMNSMSTDNAPQSSSPPRPLPRATRSSALRTSFHAENKKKYGQFGYTANPLAAKNAMFNRKGSLNSVLNSSRGSNYARPWRRINPNSYNPDNGARETTKPTPAQVGDFYLVYPFNETTRKCSAGNQDIKIVIREIQKLIKEQVSSKNSAGLSPKTFDLLPLWSSVESS